MPPSPPPSPLPPDTAATRQRMEKLAWLLDGAIPIPGTNFRFGLDAILGLVPGVGDVLGLVLGGAILYETLRIGAPRSLVVKMLGNSAADALLGVVPVVGDLADFAFKSNQRNAKLLMEHLDAIEAKPVTAKRGSRLVALLVVGSMVAAGVAIVVLAWHWALGKG